MSRVLHLFNRGGRSCAQCGHSWDFLAQRGHAFSYSRSDWESPPGGYCACVARQRRASPSPKVVATGCTTGTGDNGNGIGPEKKRGKFADIFA